MRIAYITLMSGLPWGGSEAYWSGKAFESLANNDKVFISVFDWGKETHIAITELKHKGAIIHFRQRFSHNLPFSKKIINYLGNRLNLNSKWKSLLQFKPDFVFISQGDNFDLCVHHYDLYSKLIQNKIKYSFICHNHKQYSSIPDKSIYPRGKAVFNNATEVFFVSHRQWSLTERQLCTKITNGKFTFNPLNLKKQVPIKWSENKSIQFAIVGNLISGKGHDTLFEVLAQGQWKTRDWQLNIYGKGYGLAYLKDLAIYFHITEKVNFRGHVSSATEIWEQNHILLIPSDGEGLPISLIEAAISGRTAVVTDVGGNTEIITDNITGFVACAPTPHSFSEAMQRAWKRKNEWKQMGELLSNTVKVMLATK